MNNLNIQEINSIAKDMKYEALYWALGYEEISKGIFKKEETDSFIDSERQFVTFGNKLTIIGNSKYKLDTHKSFVVLECVDRLLSMGYSASEIIIDLDNEYDIYCRNLYIKCYEWNHEKEDSVPIKKKSFISVVYSSRLISGVIERKYSARNEEGTFSQGIFEGKKKDDYYLYNPQKIISFDFEIEGTKAIRYLGNSERIEIPEGITDLAPCLFWDNQNIKEVKLPESLINISGDTFYNCANLEKITIPKNVKFMGNNPFAGCPKLILKNESSSFIYEGGTLYSKNYYKLIYHRIGDISKEYSIDSRTKIIGKHSFYLCKGLQKIVVPVSVIKLENNPFSGCDQLILENYSKEYHIVDSVIYDEDETSVIGCLNSIQTGCLKLLPVKRICRNSFWNCKGIKSIILPTTLKIIGYNPFVGCSNIKFISHSDSFVVQDGALYSKNKEKLICYPSKFAKGDIYLPDETITLERGAFSGATELTGIHLHNVSIISKTCFTNCASLQKIYCSDVVCYIGEWAFAHCKNLTEISIGKDCVLDNNVIMNSPTRIIRRKEHENIIVESDNIYTLQSLAKSYTGKIKSILIDPPYNSNIDYIGYQDSSFIHGYYHFMKERIAYAYQLLSEDGFLVINIDEGEVVNLTNLCKEFFGSLVSVHKWEKLHPFFDKNRNVNPLKKNVLYEYIIICSKSKKAVLNKIMQPYLMENRLLEKETNVPEIFSCFGTNSSAKDEIMDLFGERNYFATPKPVKLIKELVRATTNKESIVLDFFAGSGTTGQAVVELNREDSGNRKFILVSNNESDICRKVTVERVVKTGIKFSFVD